MYKRIKVELKNNAKRYIIGYESELPEYIYTSQANRFLKPFKNNRKSFAYDAYDYVGAIVDFLNFLVEKGYDPETECKNITFEDAQEYLFKYCAEPNKKKESKSDMAIIGRCRHIATYLMNLKDAGNKNLEEHYLKRVESERSQVGRKRIKYEFSLFFDKSEQSNKVFRKCPMFFITTLLEEAKKFSPDIWMLIVLQVAAGLRPSEACNVRCEDSCYGPGITMRYGEARNVKKIVIDISKETWKRPLRNDGVYIGRIKRPRFVEVYPENVEFLATCLDLYYGLTASRKRENYKPLVTNVNKSDGYNKAKSYDSYRKAFHKLVETRVLPRLMEQGGEAESFAREMQGESFGPHMLREGFTCQLVRRGEDFYGLMGYRGDKNPESSLVYILKGGLLEDVKADVRGELEKEMKEYRKKNYEKISIPRFL